MIYQKGMSKEELIFAQLKHPKTAKRRAAAKKLRKLQLKKGCSYLKESLLNEVNIPKTWETLYHIIMAIGESNCSSCLSKLYYILHHHSLVPMVRIAIADSITRIEMSDNFLEKAFNQRDIDLVNGALRAHAMEHLKLSNNHLIDNLIDFLLHQKDELSFFWLIAAAPGCTSDALSSYIKEWSHSDNVDISTAAQAALKHKYLKWSIL